MVRLVQMSVTTGVDATMTMQGPYTVRLTHHVRCW